jgi:sporulation protein YlmC with PRC-barrel domain
MSLGMQEDAMEAAQETGKLISADKVEGTNVYNTLGDTLGAIHDLMIDKATGKVAYALMSFGGFLGIGNQYHSLPWSLLKYDTNLGGYVINLDKRRLEGAPAYDVGTEPAWGDRSSKARFTTITGWGPTGPM